MRAFLWAGRTGAAGLINQTSTLLRTEDGQGFVSEDEYLEISDIKRDQSGEYECSALNDVAAPDVRKVKITVNYPPYISKAKNMGVSVGQKGILSCEASAVPTAEFQWFKEDTRLATGLDGVRVESRGHISTLTFFNVSEKDYGNYTCVATNKLGNTNASITLYDIGIFKMTYQLLMRKPMISQANNIEKQYVMDCLECASPSTQSRYCPGRISKPTPTAQRISLDPPVPGPRGREEQELSIITVIIPNHSDRSEHLWITDGNDSPSSASSTHQKAVLVQVLQRCKLDI
ncbi:hypothetical protein E2I00_004312 [Balaenoptera physalus]|uniref:Ig-like domain-containing protein n=1 Tax=Balaenoptera physalus TaxID=9770 RepID=A0A6A1QHF9_BALPH|nr:hypothetical protein E2I00_004312 [Balaenoptera physalus]